LAEHFRRTDPRYDRQISVEMTCDGDDHIVRTNNLSLGGMYVDSRRSLPVGAVVQLRFHVSTQPEAIEVSGDVRWVVPGNDGVGMGIRFQGLRARDVWALNRFFETPI